MASSQLPDWLIYVDQHNSNTVRKKYIDILGPIYLQGATIDLPPPSKIFTPQKWHEMIFWVIFGGWKILKGCRTLYNSHLKFPL